MTTATASRGDNDALRDGSAALRAARPPTSYLDEGHTIRSWLTTHDHKRIGILFALTITAFFFVGGAAATLIRLELATPVGDVVSAETYNKLFTMHGVIMVWFFLIPSIPSTLGNFLVPMMIGARDLAFPRLNLTSWYLYVGGATFALAAMIVGGVDTGWTFYAPFSTMFSNTHVFWVLAGVFVVGFSSILTGINLIVTTHTMRAPGMGWFRLPLFVWAQYATSLILVLATPVLAMTLVLLAVERYAGIGIFDPALGGDPLLFQHLFWFYSHPAVYIMLLPAMGVVSEVVACYARNPIFGYRTMAYAIVAIAALGLPRLGPSHVRVRTVDVRRHRVFDAELPRRDPVGDQGVQLDGDAVARQRQLRCADALCARLHRPVHDRRHDRPFPRRRSRSTCI